MPPATGGFAAPDSGAYQPGVLVTYALRVQGVTAYGAQSYLDGPSTVVTTVTSRSAATSDSDLLYLVDTMSFT